MISLRAHVVTIVAVFLALAIGLLVGGAFVDPVLEDRLRDQTEVLRRDNSDLRAELDDVRAQIAGVGAFVDAALPHLTENRLLGESVVVVAQEGVEDAVIGETQRALEGAGAELIAVISARNEVASQDPETQFRLAEVLGLSVAEPEELPADAAAALASRLANGDDGGEVQDDLLARLLSAGFLAPVGSGLSEEALTDIGLDGQIVVVLAGGPDEAPAVPPETFAIPLVEALIGFDTPVAAGESVSTAVSFVESMRGTEGLVTVDDLDLSMGGAALVLGLDTLLISGRGGAYGIKDGADPLPPLP